MNDNLRFIIVIKKLYIFEDILHYEYSHQIYYTPLPNCQSPLNTYSLAIGTEPLLFGLAIILAWLRARMMMVEGRNRHGSPSTCIGMAFRVFSLISRH